MKKGSKKIVCILSCILLATVIIPSILVQASSTSKVKIGKFEKELQLTAGTEESLIKEGEYDPNAELTWRVAVVMTNRADIIMNGTSYNQEVYDNVVNYHRLSIQSKLEDRLNDTEKDYAIQSFVKGIIPGETMGTYSQSRKLYADYYVSRADADKILERLKSKTKRIKLTPDGQVTRTVNLPKNYKKFNYILASFPNEYYEKKFRYLKATFSYQPVNLKEYASPKDLSKVTYNTGYETMKFTDMYAQYGDEWINKIKTNLETRLNFDYRTSGDEWISRLHNTYYIYGDAVADKKRTTKIKDYVNTAKKNHVVIQSQKIVIEPSSMYKFLGDFYVRCYVKFKVSADKVYTTDENRQNELIFSSMSNTYLINLKNNKWYEGYYDIAIGGTAYGDDGATFSVTHDMIVD